MSRRHGRRTTKPISLVKTALILFCFTVAAAMQRLEPIQEDSSSQSATPAPGSTTSLESTCTFANACDNSVSGVENAEENESLSPPPTASLPAPLLQTVISAIAKAEAEDRNSDIAEEEAKRSEAGEDDTENDEKLAEDPDRIAIVQYEELVRIQYSSARQVSDEVRQGEGAISDFRFPNDIEGSDREVFLRLVRTFKITAPGIECTLECTNPNPNPHPHKILCWGDETSRTFLYYLRDSSDRRYDTFGIQFDGAPWMVFKEYCPGSEGYMLIPYLQKDGTLDKIEHKNANFSLEIIERYVDKKEREKDLEEKPRGLKFGPQPKLSDWEDAHRRLERQRNDD